MGGTVHGSVDHLTQVIGANGQQEAFTILYNFFTNQMIGEGNAELVASNYGFTGTGFDFWDGANPSGENAWACFKMLISDARPGNSNLGAYYVLIQWALAAPFGASPGNPGLLLGGTGDGVGITVAFREDGTSPWGGTTGSPGSDTKGTPVWTPGTSTLHVMDRSCATGGTYATNKENVLKVCDASAAVTRIHCIGDADSFLIFADQGNDTSYEAYLCSLYVPLDHLTVSYPIAVFGSGGLPMATATTFGTTAGNTAAEGLIICSDASGPADSSTSIDRLEARILNSSAYQPNPMAPGGTYDEPSLAVAAYDTGQGLYGWLGTIDFWRESYGMPSNTANSALTKACFGSAVTGSIKLVVPWGSASGPGSGTTRAGRQF